jgi:hypothetical protein
MQAIHGKIKTAQAKLNLDLNYLNPFEQMTYKAFNYDVRDLDYWDKMMKMRNGKKFDVVLMDASWKGTCIDLNYTTMKDDKIMNIPMNSI